MSQLCFVLPDLDIPEFDQTEVGSAGAPDLSTYHLILVNISAGKDSQACLDMVMEAARAAGVADRVYAVHADLGEMEWPGVRELAAEHAAHYGLRSAEDLAEAGEDPAARRFIVVRRTGNDLLARIAERKKFPDAQNRYCTSDFKRGPVRRAMTALVADLRAKNGLQQIRVLNVMGMRAQESPARRRLASFSHDGSETCPCLPCRRRVAQAKKYRQRKEKVPARYKVGHGASNTRRHVDVWLPIHHWTVEEVWQRIAQAGTRPHPAYAAGMPRLSCVFCVLASRSALVRAAQLMPDLADRYAEVEKKIGHRFQRDRSMAEIIAEAESAPPVDRIEDWVA